MEENAQGQEQRRKSDGEDDQTGSSSGSSASEVDQGEVLEVESLEERSGRYQIRAVNNETYTWKQNTNDIGHDMGVGVQITLQNSHQTSLLLSEGNIRETIPAQHLGGADGRGLWVRRNGGGAQRWTEGTCRGYWDERQPE